MNCWFTLPKLFKWFSTLCISDFKNLILIQGSIDDLPALQILITSKDVKVLYDEYRDGTGHMKLLNTLLYNDKGK
mgnify:FL=1|jgi:hypothetical protein